MRVLFSLLEREETMNRFVWLCAVALVICLNSETSLKAQDVVIAVGPNGTLVFEPDNVTVPTGATVCWTWAGPHHSVTADDGSFDSDIQDDGFQYVLKFDTAGDYPYHCSPHQIFGMVGVIHVVDQPAAYAYTKPIGITSSVLAVGALGLIGYKWRRRKPSAASRQ